MGIPLAVIAGTLVACVEFFGGLALLMGLGTRIASVLLVGTMLGAIAFVHLKNGFFLPRGFEYAFTMLAANVGLALAGPGTLALDNRFGQTSEVNPELSRVA